MMVESDLTAPPAPESSRPSATTPPTDTSSVGTTSTGTTSTSLRRTSDTVLRSKFACIYEAFFKGENPSLGHVNFWDELLLYKVNAPFLRKCIIMTSEEQLLAIKDHIHAIFYNCCLVLREDTHPVRVTNSLHTLAILLEGIFRKKFHNFGCDVIHLITGIDNAETSFKGLLMSLDDIITGAHPLRMKAMAMRLLLIVATATPNINRNTLLEYFVVIDVFPTLVRIISRHRLRDLAADALFLLVVLVNYQKYEAPSHYLQQVEEVDDERLLNALGSVLATLFLDSNRSFHAVACGSASAKPTSFFGSITNAVGHMLFSSEQPLSTLRDPPPYLSVALLSLYEFVHLNHSFVTLLTHTLPGGGNGALAPCSGGNGGTLTPTDEVTPPESPRVVTKSTASSVVVSSNEDELNASYSSLLSLSSVGSSTPTNLISVFFTLCSYLFQDMRQPWQIQHARLSLIILTIITDDLYANSHLYDPGVNVPVTLYERPSRHRRKPSSFDASHVNSSQPLACNIFTLVVSFISSNLKRSMQADLLSRALGIVHRMLCHQKKFRIRIRFRWQPLWEAMVALLKFVLGNEKSLVTEHSQNVFELMGQVINIFNMFITYGDTFLADPSDYDQLYYEIIRVDTVFFSVQDICKEHISEHGVFAEDANRVLGKMSNIKAIIRHMSPKINDWSNNNDSALTPDHVLDVIRNNYDTLTLKLQESLDQVPHYVENPHEVSFFRSFTRSLVNLYASGNNATIDALAIDPQMNLTSQLNSLVTATRCSK